jgi:hypothetical protein
MTKTSIKPFRQYLAERQGYPTWVRATVVTLILRVRDLTKRIEDSNDQVTKQSLLAQQNKLLAYISGLGIAIDTKDDRLLNRLKRP